MALILSALFFSATGCNSASSPTPAATSAPAITYPAHPTAAPAPFKIFHYYEHSFTLTVSDKASDDEIASLIWKLRDAAHTHSFDRMKIKQEDVDSGSSTWFHIYRGTKCAPEKYADGKLPCGNSYHASGDYTFSKVNNQPWDRGVLVHDEKETQLWNPDAPYSAPVN